MRVQIAGAVDSDWSGSTRMIEIVFEGVEIAAYFLNHQFLCSLICK